MPSGSGARRYAQAVFDLARESGRIDQWHDDLELMAGVFRDNRILFFFESPRRSIEEKDRAAVNMFQGRVQPEALSMLRLLVQRDRTAAVPAIYQRFQELEREAKGIVTAEVTTAVPVDDAERRRIGERLSQMTGKQIELHTKVDPSIIGGVVVRMDDKLIDGSVRTSLAQLRERLTLG